MIWVVIFGVLITLFGGAVFSFVNVVAWRLPRGLDFVKGRSFCPECLHSLGALDMLPIFGYILLGGKCRYCGEKIPLKYLLIEIAGGALALFCVYSYYPHMLKAFVTFVFLSMLAFVTLTDAETMEIPDTASLIIALIGVASALIFKDIKLLSRVIGVFSVSIPLFLIASLIPGAFGGGDIKLMAACGIFLGWKLNLFALFCAVILGGGYAMYLMATKKAKAKEHFAFGPFLCAGMVISLFWGDFLINCYIKLL